MTTDDFLDRLRSALPPNSILDPEAAAAHLVDHRKIYSGTAHAVIRPRTVEDVSLVVRSCAAEGISVVTQGGNTGLSGGAIPVPDRPAVLLLLSRLNQIENINPAQSTITAQAGVTIEALHDAAKSVKRKFAPDWGARGSATIGGAIATDAGGNNVLRYGNMRDQILGVEVVLPDGRIWNGLSALRKDSSGYDLKQLFIGSEGTLGVVTRAVVRLVPHTPEVQSGFAALSSLDQLGRLYELAHEAAPDIVTAFELVPEVGLQKVCDVYNIARPLTTSAEFYVLIRLASVDPVTDRLSDFFTRAAAEALITDAVIAATPDQEERLWTIRDELPPTGLYALQHHGLKMDVAVPIDLMVEYHETVRAIAREVVPDALAYGFGHVGDGNLHMMILPIDEADVPAFLETKQVLQDRIDEATFALGGTLSAEHGVGVELRNRMGGQKSTIEQELMHTLKAAFDPNNIMNPGKTLAP